MTSRDFCYWLQGFIEIREAESPETRAKGIALDAHQVNCIKNHLKLVFKHEIDPANGGDAQALQDIHDATGPNAHLMGHMGAGVRC